MTGSAHRSIRSIGSRERWRADLANAHAQVDRRAEVAALCNIGFWLNWQARHVEAKPYLTQALALARGVGDQFHVRELPLAAPRLHGRTAVATRVALVYATTRVYNEVVSRGRRA